MTATATLQPVGFDIDGTLCTTPADIDHDDGDDLLRRCQPIPAAVRAAQALRAMGHPIVLITARSPLLRAVTEQQARAWLGFDVEVAMRSRSVWDARRMAPDKAAAIQQHGACLLIDDRPEGRDAARLAGVRFVWAHDLHRFGLNAITTALHHTEAPEPEVLV